MLRHSYVYVLRSTSHGVNTHVLNRGPKGVRSPMDEDYTDPSKNASSNNSTRNSTGALRYVDSPDET